MVGMLPLSYTISSDLRELLGSVDELRTNILVTPLSPSTEHALSWEATVGRISGSLSLGGVKLTKRDIEKILSRQAKTKPSIVSGYLGGINFVHDLWTANSQVVTVSALDTLARLVYVGPFAPYKQIFGSSQKPIRQLLTYLENQTEHPVVHAGIALGILSGAILPADHPGLVSRLIAILFLAKDGYDLRGMAAIEQEWAREASSYHVALSTIQHEGNLNHWLLFFAQSVEASYTKLKERLGSSIRRESSKLWTLNERQRAILHLVDDPGISITNKIVQKRFRISQITASRDLAKLTALTLLFPHGKGRSVFYTRV